MVTRKVKEDKSEVHSWSKNRRNRLCCQCHLAHSINENHRRLCGSSSTLLALWASEC